MKTKTILILTAVALIGGAAWIPHRLMAAITVSSDKKILYYTCPMHPSVKSDKPGNCPDCGMKLLAVYADATGTNAVTASPSCNMGGCGGGCCGGGN